MRFILYLFRKVIVLMAITGVSIHGESYKELKVAKDTPHNHCIRDTKKRKLKYTLVIVSFLAVGGGASVYFFCYPLNNSDLNDTENKKHMQAVEDAMAKIAVGTITEANTNQYQVSGESSCAYFGGGVVFTHLVHPKKNLHDPALLDQLLKDAAKKHPGAWSGFHEDVANFYKFKIDTSAKTPFLYTEDAIAKEIIKGIAAKEQGALLQNGQETWALLVNEDQSMDIANSHTQTNKNIFKSSIERFGSGQEKEVASTIASNNFFINEGGFKNEFERQQGCVRIYWATLLDKS